jgi:hypothetical protein
MIVPFGTRAFQRGPIVRVVFTHHTMTHGGITGHYRHRQPYSMALLPYRKIAPFIADQS